MTKTQQLEKPIADIERAVEMQKQAARYPKARLPEASIRIAEKAIAEMRDILKKNNMSHVEQLRGKSVIAK